jgi:hypothetical protein
MRIYHQFPFPLTSGYWPKITGEVRFGPSLAPEARPCVCDTSRNEAGNADFSLVSPFAADLPVKKAAFMQGVEALELEDDN